MCGHPTVSETKKRQKKKRVAEPAQTGNTLVRRQSETQASGRTDEPSEGAQVCPSHAGKGGFRTGTVAPALLDARRSLRTWRHAALRGRSGPQRPQSASPTRKATSKKADHARLQTEVWARQARSRTKVATRIPTAGARPGLAGSRHSPATLPPLVAQRWRLRG